MIDIRLIRKNRQEVETKLKTKDSSIDLSLIVKLDEQIREIKTKVEQLKSHRNDQSTLIGTLKKGGQKGGKGEERGSGLAFLI